MQWYAAIYAIVDGKVPVYLYSAFREPLGNSIVPNESATHRIEFICAIDFDISIASSRNTQINGKIQVSPTMTHADIRKHLSIRLMRHQVPHKLTRLQFMCYSNQAQNFEIADDDTPINPKIYDGTWMMHGEAIAASFE